MDSEIFGGAAENFAGEFLVVFDVLFALAFLDAVERRLSHKDLAARDEFLHVAEEEGEQQGTNVRTVDVGVGHDDDLAVTKLGEFEVFAFTDACADGGDHGANFFVAEHLVVTGFFDVENFAFERQDGLIATVAAGFGGAAGRFAFD